MRKAVSLTIAFALAVIGFGFIAATAKAQNSGGERIEQLAERLKTSLDQFDRSVDVALDRSRLDNSELEDQMNALVDELEYEADRLEDRAEDGTPIANDVVNVLGSALRLDVFMLKHRLSPAAERDWAQVRGVLDRMARHYNVAWVWTVTNNPVMSKASKREVLDRIEERADEFSESFDDALDRSRADGRQFEDHMNKVVYAFEEALDRLDSQMARSDEMSERDVLTVMNNAQAIEDYMRKYRMTPRARRDWARVKVNLDDLARMTGVTWVWVAKPGAPVTATDANKPTVQNDGRPGSKPRKP